VARADYFFRRMDADGNGSLSADEVRDALTMMGHEAASSEVAHLLHDFDTDGDGEISPSEFREIYAASPPGFLMFQDVAQDKLRHIEEVTFIQSIAGRLVSSNAPRFGRCLFFPISPRRTNPVRALIPWVILQPAPSQLLYIL